MDLDTTEVVKFPFPFMTEALSPFFGPTVSRAARTQMRYLCKLPVSVKSRFSSLCCLFFFFLNNRICEFLESFPPPLCKKPWYYYLCLRSEVHSRAPS